MNDMSGKHQHLYQVTFGTISPGQLADTERQVSLRCRCVSVVTVVGSVAAPFYSFAGVGDCRERTKESEHKPLSSSKLQYVGTYSVHN